MRGWSPSVTTTASQSASSASPHASEAAWPSSQREHTRGSAPWRSTVAMISSAPEPEHDHHAPDRRGGHRRSEVLEQRQAVELGELLRRPEARGGARREHEAADQAPTSWMRPAGLREAAAVAAVPHGHDLGHDRQRGLLGAHGAEVESDRRGDAVEQLLVEAGGEQALAPCACARRLPIAPT